MDQAVAIDTGAGSTFKGVMQGIHPSMKLCGTSDKYFHDLLDDLLTYVKLVLKDESPLAPEASLDEWSGLLNFLRSNWIIPFAYRTIGCLPRETSVPG